MSLSRLVTGVVLLLAVFVSAWFAAGVIEHGPGNDFRVIWQAANSAEPYAASDWPFPYPPTALFLVQPLRLIALEPAFVLWASASAAAYAWATRIPWLLVLFPATFALVTGQISLFVAAILISAFQSGWTGILLGLAFCLKPQLAYLAPLALMMIKAHREIAIMALTIVTISLAATIAFGVGIWLDWVRAGPHFIQRAEEIGVLRAAASPAGVAHYFGINPIPFALAGLALGCALIVREFCSSAAKGPLLALCCILASPYALSYDLVAILPLTAPHLVRQDIRTLPAVLSVTYAFQVIGLIALAVLNLCQGRRQAPEKSP